MNFDFHSFVWYTFNMNTVKETKVKFGRELTDEDVLVGESGGTSAVYEVGASSLVPGLLMVETEHGYLFLDPDSEFICEA